MEALGGNRKRAKDDPPSPNLGIEDEAFRNYADHMVTDEFRQRVARLMESAAGEPAAIMCAEGDYRHCHRDCSATFSWPTRSPSSTFFPAAKTNRTR